MEKTQITQCPKCDTTFKVTPAQLNVAKGAVRCGACLHVFRASDYFQQEENKAEPQDDRTQDMFSESLFEEKLRKLSKIEDEQGFKYDLPKSFLFPKNDLKKVIRKLNRDSLEKDFYYDVQKEKEAKADEEEAEAEVTPELVEDLETSEAALVDQTEVADERESARASISDWLSKNVLSTK